MNPKILIVDDVPNNLKILYDTLESEGYRIVVANDGKSALKAAARALPDLVLLDIVMPDMNGYEVCKRLKQNREIADIPVIFVTVKDDNVSLVEGFQVGGVDYIIKPFEKEELLVRIETHLKINRLTQELLQKNKALEEGNKALREQISLRERAEKAQQESEKARKQTEEELQKADGQLSLISQQEATRWGIDGFIGKSTTVGKILADVRRLQNSDRTNVLITGESGTGKELIARAIHFGGTRAKGSFIPLNCSAIPSELAESTLFGHVRGAFTGANTDQKGYFELASGGTLFLDEIGDMPISLQAKLLRAIEDGRIAPVGATHGKHVDVRILSATNADLQAKISEGAFREDLYFRLAGFTVNVPPLRERKEDIPLLAQHFLSIFATEMGITGLESVPTLSRETIDTLKDYNFPGNVRELKNIIEHSLLIMNGNSIIQPEHLRLIDITARESPMPTSEENSEPETDFEHLKELVIKRSQKTILEEEPSEQTNEEKILTYLEKHDSINNSECRDLLSVELRYASHLLNKLYQYGLLEREGQRRWSRYYLKGQVY